MSGLGQDDHRQNLPEYSYENLHMNKEIIRNKENKMGEKENLRSAIQ
jgi:hypothetical protein